MRDSRLPLHFVSIATAEPFLGKPLRRGVIGAVLIEEPVSDDPLSERLRVKGVYLTADELTSLIEEATSVRDGCV